MSFFSDRKVLWQTFSGMWDLKDGKLVTNFPSVGLGSAYTYKFLNNDKTLSLFNPDGSGIPSVWTKHE
jgi:hypothetical protein